MELTFKVLEDTCCVGAAFFANEFTYACHFFSTL